MCALVIIFEAFSAHKCTKFDVASSCARLNNDDDDAAAIVDDDDDDEDDVRFIHLIRRRHCTPWSIPRILAGDILNFN